MNGPSKFEVRSFTRSWDNRGYPKNWAVPGYAHAPFSSKFVMGFYSNWPCKCTRDGKEPSLHEYGSVRVLPNMRVRSVRVLSSYEKMKVRFWFGSLCRVFGSVRFGSMRVLIHIYPVYMLFSLHRIHSVSQKNPLTLSPNGWEFLVQILLAY